MNKQALGLFQAISAFIFWGLYPVYFKLLSDLPALEVMLYRLIFAFPFMLVILAVRLGVRATLSGLRASLRLLPLLFLTSFLISMNWLSYIWAVNTNAITEASLGYFSSPLITIFFSLVFLKESLPRLKKIALIIAVIAVALRIFHYGEFPVLVLTLGFSFSLYGLIKKIVQNESRHPSLLFFIETGLALPVALIILFTVFGQSITFWSTQSSLTIDWLIFGLGGVTVFPLLLFNLAVQKIDLSRIGFLQYIAPCMLFLMAIVVYREPFTFFDLSVFALIWIALALILFDDTQQHQSHKRISASTV